MMATVRARKITLWLFIMAIAAALNLGGCGEDVQTQPNQVRKKSKRKRRRGRKAGKAGKGQLQFYPKVETYVSDPEEAGKIRHTFIPKDFEPDPTGEVNRDPFRSYVIRQPGLGLRDTSDSEAEITKACNANNLVATSYSLRDLRLVGIVLRGTRSYALFRDTAALGHIVRKGDCLGSEKARVAAIRAGFVSLEVTTDTSPDRIPQQRSIQLYPDELNVDVEAR